MIIQTFWLASLCYLQIQLPGLRMPCFLYLVFQTLLICQESQVNQCQSLFSFQQLFYLFIKIIIINTFTLKLMSLIQIPYQIHILFFYFVNSMSTSQKFDSLSISVGSASKSKIHPLGSRSKLLRETMQQTSQFNNTSKSFCKSVKVGLPVSFGIDPTQAAFLIKQLNEMRKKYAQLERQVTENSRVDAQMIDVISQSTRNLELRMSQVRLQNQIECEKQKENRQYRDLLIQKQAQIENCNRVIQTLNQATNKINQLQEQNKYLLEKLRQEKNQNQRISKENGLLKQKIDQIEKDKEIIIQGIGYQLQKLRGLKIKKEQYSLSDQKAEEVIEENYGLLTQQATIKYLNSQNQQMQLKNKRQADHSQSMEETQQVSREQQSQQQQEQKQNDTKSHKSNKSSRLRNNCYRQ